MININIRKISSNFVRNFFMVILNFFLDNYTLLAYNVNIKEEGEFYQGETR